jgi:hypothetical protein
MTITDLIKDLIDTSKERLKTPISGAFFWSFLIYNWRPIVELMFSKVSIEDRIYIINQEYCNKWAIIIPIVIALVYTMFIPKVTLLIDELLLETKKKRVNNIYLYDNEKMSTKIKIAEKEFRLATARSGKKEIDDLLDQIDILKKTNDQLITNNKNTSNQLTIAFKENNDLKTSIANEKWLENNSSTSSIVKQAYNIIDTLSDDDKLKFKDLVVENDELIFKSLPQNLDSLKRFEEMRLVYIKDDGYRFTNLGEVVAIFVQLNDLKVN